VADRKWGSIASARAIEGWQLNGAPLNRRIAHRDGKDGPADGRKMDGEGHYEDL